MSSARATIATWLRAEPSSSTTPRSLLGKLLKNIPVPAESHSYVVMEEVKESMQLVLGRA